MANPQLIQFLHDQPRAINKVGSILQKKGFTVEGSSTTTAPNAEAAVVVVDVPSAADAVKIANSLKAMGFKKPVVVLSQRPDGDAAEGVTVALPAKLVDTVMSLVGGRADHGTVESIIAGKTAKLKELRARGVEPFPHRWTKKDPVAAVNDLGAPLKPEEHSGKTVTTAGRVVQLRLMGKAAFFHLQDGSGKAQAYIRVDSAGEDAFNLLKNDIQIGDFAGVSGEVFKTKTGEPSVHVKKIDILAKALRPLPEKWHGLKDVEARFRQRHLDLISSAEVREVFKRRSVIIDSVRRTFRDLGYLEVETPILLQQAGGASATPFKTFHRALGTDLYLRIATELYLKRLIIGGFDRVYEIGRIFRNEGIDTRHNPEFSMLEAYCAYADYHDMAALLESVIANAAKAIGIDSIEYRGNKISLKPPFRRLYMPELWISECGEDIHNILKGKGFNRPALVSLAKRLAIEASDETPSAKIFERIFDEKLLPHLVQPAFIFDHPTAITPLAKCKPGDESIVERFEFFLGTEELANAYTELNDPLDQRERFEEQGRQRQGGNEEADILDEDFVQAMEAGMPPTGGIGIGIDRLAMILTGNPSIREVILFPTLKPEGLEK